MYLTDLYEDDLDISIKVVIVGNGAVGKSSMIQRYCKGVFTPNYKKTIGVDFLEKQLRIHGEEVRLMLWDTAGQEEFDAITKAYYRGAQACVIAFSTTDRNSFEAVKKWKRKVEEECGHIPMVLVQNKIEDDEVDRLVKDTKMRFYKTSVKEDLNISHVFQHLSENYVNKYKSSSSSPCFQDDFILRDIGLTNKPSNAYLLQYNNNDIFASSSTTKKKKKKKKILNNQDSFHHLELHRNGEHYWSLSPERTITLKPLGGKNSRHFAPSHYYYTTTSSSNSKNKLFHIKNSCKLN